MVQAQRRRPTIVDVAQAAGVSVKTVSRVINGVSTVDTEMAARVVRAVQDLGFRRNSMAHSLRAQQKTPGIGLVIEDVANPFYSAIAAGAGEVAFERDAMLLIASSEADPQRERRLLLSMCERRVDGLLVVPTRGSHRYLRAEVAMGTAVVTLDRPAPDLPADSVVIDNMRGAREAVGRLLGAGHQRIALLADSLDITTMADRMGAAQAMLTQAGLPTRPDLVAEGLHEPHSTARAVAGMLALRRPPTAFFCLNNRNTIGAIQELERLGSPAAVAGFDDFETAHLLRRDLVIVSYDAKEIGRQGARLLFQRMEAPRARRRHVVIPTEIVEHRRAR